MKKIFLKNVYLVVVEMNNGTMKVVNMKFLRKNIFFWKKPCDIVTKK